MASTEALKAVRVPVGPMRNLDYLLVDKESGEAIAVDSGWETAPLIRAAKNEDARVLYVVATHHHFDHTATIRELAQKLGSKLVAHRNSDIGPDVLVDDGDVLTLGKKTVRVIYTPGHTTDSICLYDGQKVFTGDTLFIGNCGRTDLPGGSPDEMYHSLHEVLAKLPPATMIYPGHDYGDVPSRTLGEETKSNPTLLAKTLEEFLGVE